MGSSTIFPLSRDSCIQHGRLLTKGGVRGIRIPQNRTEMRINTAQNNMRKPQTALKLPVNFLILETTWFCKTAIPQLQIKLPQNGTKNRAKTASPQTLMPHSLYPSGLLSLLVIPRGSFPGSFHLELAIASLSRRTLRAGFT